MTVCQRNASCRCQECLEAMGMFSAKDLTEIASSSIKFEEDELQPQVEQRVIPPPVKRNKILAEAKEEEKENIPNKAITKEAGNRNESIPQSVDKIVKAKIASSISIEENSEDFNAKEVIQLISDTNWKARKVAYGKIICSIKEDQAEISKWTENGDLISLLSKLCNESSVAALDGALESIQNLLQKSELCSPLKPKLAEQETITLLLKPLAKKAFVARATTKKLCFDVLSELCFFGGSTTTNLVLSFYVELLNNKHGRCTPKSIEAVLESLEQLVKSYGMKDLDVMNLREVVLFGLQQRQVPIRGKATDLASVLNNFLKGTFYSLLAQETNSKAKFSSEKQKDEIEKVLKMRFDPQMKASSSYFAMNKVKNSGENLQENPDLQASEEEEAQIAMDEVYNLLPANKVMFQIDKGDFNFFQQVKEKKWMLRKQALQKVVQMCGQPPKLCSSEDFSPLVHELRLIFASDSNINVVIGAVNVCTALLSGLRHEFHKYLFVVLDSILQKLKDKKVTVGKAVDIFLDEYALHLFSLACEKSTETIFGYLRKACHKTIPPLQRVRLLEWLTRSVEGYRVKAQSLFCVCRTNKDTAVDVANMRFFLDSVKDCLEDADVKVRKKAVEVLLMFDEDFGETSRSAFCKKCKSLFKPVVLETIAQAKSGFPKLFNTGSSVDLGSSCNSSVSVSKKTDSVSTTKSTPTGVKQAVKTQSLSTESRTVKAKKIETKVSLVNPGELRLLKYEFKELDSSRETLNSKLGTEFSESWGMYESAQKWQDKLPLYDSIIMGLNSSVQTDVEDYLAILNHITNGFSERNFNLLNKCWNVLELLCVHNKITDSESTVFKLFYEKLISGFQDRKQASNIQNLILELSSSIHPNTFLQEVLEIFIVSKTVTATFKTQLSIIQISHILVDTFGISNLDVNHLCHFAIQFAYFEKRPHKSVPPKCEELLKVVYSMLGDKIYSLVTNDKIISVLKADACQKLFQNVVVKTDVGVDGNKEIKSQLRKTHLIDLDAVVEAKADLSQFLHEHHLMEQLSEEKDKTSWKVRMAALTSISDFLHRNQGKIGFDSHPMSFKELLRILKRRLKESNKNLVIKCVKLLGLLGASFEEDASKRSLFFQFEALSVVKLLNDSSKLLLSAVMAALEQWLGEPKSLSVLCEIVSLCGDCFTDPKLDRYKLLNWVSKSLSENAATESSGNKFENLFDTLLPGIVSCLQSKDSKTRLESICIIRFFAKNSSATVVFDHIKSKMRDLKPAVKRTLISMLQAKVAEFSVNTSNDNTSKNIPQAKSGSAKVTTTRKRDMPTRPTTSSTQELPIDKSDKNPVDQIVYTGLEGLTPASALAIRKRREVKAMKNKWPTIIDDRTREMLMLDVEQEMSKTASMLLLPIALDKIFCDEIDKVMKEVSLLDAVVSKAAVGGSEEDLLRVGANFDLLCKLFTLKFNINNSSFNSQILDIVFCSLKAEITFLKATEGEGQFHSPNMMILLPHLCLKLSDKQERFRVQTKKILSYIKEHYSSFRFSQFLVAGVLRSTKAGRTNVLMATECLDVLIENYKTSMTSQITVLFAKRLLPLVDENLSGREVKAAVLKLFDLVFEFLSFSKTKLNSLLEKTGSAFNDKTKKLLFDHLNISRRKSIGVTAAAYEPQNTNKEPISTRTLSIDSPPKKDLFGSQFNLPGTPPSPAASTIKTPKLAKADSGSKYLKEYDSLFDSMPPTPQTPRFESGSNFMQRPQATPGEFTSMKLPPTPSSINNFDKDDAISEFSFLASELKQSKLLHVSTRSLRSFFQLYAKIAEKGFTFEISGIYDQVFSVMSCQDEFLEVVLSLLLDFQATSILSFQHTAIAVRRYLDIKSANGLKLTNVNVEKVVEILEEIYEKEGNKEIVERVLEALLSSGYFLADYCSQKSTLKVFLARYYIRNKTFAQSKTSHDLGAIRARINRIRREQTENTSQATSNISDDSLLDRIRSRMHATK